MEVDIRSLISSDHKRDIPQLNAIFSDSSRIMLEAPAGCGKTKTMVSKVAYLLATNDLPTYKKILALTFSVNSAFKMKKDIAEKLPGMGIGNITSPTSLNKKVSITNYHGFARRVISLYGYLLHPDLPDINLFTAFNERNIEGIRNADVELTENQASLLQSFSNFVNDCDINNTEKYFDQYCNLLLTKFVPKQIITYNGYLVLCYKLLNTQLSLKQFYQLIYPYIIIDEFQDTNYLSWKLIKLLITPKTKLFFMGDSLQRIYGFIGAIPDLMNLAIKEYGMTKISLSKNYRFRFNPNMLLLDKNLRCNAENYINPVIEEDALLNFSYFDKQEQEAQYVSKTIKELLLSTDNKVAILIQQRNPNVDIILKQLENDSIDYFYGLFRDDDPEYIRYHQETLKIFFMTLQSSNSKRIGKILLNKVYRQLCYSYKESSKVIQSLLLLTEAFFSKLLTEYSFLDNEEKIAYINDTFENRALKQSMDYIENRVFISTIHGAKGLEWNYVILPDMEPYVFPNYSSLCGNCDYRTGRINAGDYCRMQVENHNSKEILEQLSVFYVAVTRAKKEVIFSASKKRYNADGELLNSKICCLLSLPGIILK